MTKEALAIELMSMRKRAERTAQNINQILRNLSAELRSLNQTVEEYGAKRVELFKHELQVRGMTWCTRCLEGIPESETELLLFEGREKYPHGYGNDCYEFQDFSILSRACPTCCEYATDRHGQKGTYDSLAKDQTSFYAFRVERREDGYYARKFGNWVKLDNETHKLDEPPSLLAEKLAEEYNLPPKIEVDQGVQDHMVELIVHE